MTSKQGGGPRTYSAVISGLEVWCSRDCLGRVAGYFLSESDAVAAAEFYNAQITITQVDEPTTGVWVFDAVYVVVYSNGRAVTKKRYIAVDPQTEEIIGQIYETYDALAVALTDRPAP
ncbi:hypothetical protein EJ070_24885 [Mesorhizobium sp. M1E.F.Ca.ET.045.02.1.1]|uniref:hypothetical protein n=1 Tax=unclassified Mesorhizobium TaxID=325217 RepID=UPI000F754710|nr:MULTISPECIES: hypothetical protein [unclassified Mesorhizobium]AZO23592.1 hypothetical protein EJ070_24885 [Mesorhizobium sp. M1E.F.Ca.ET.045.02.1.1]RUW29470.1 hypothetical protein EOA38_22965 [Mesorhizobium sp. M1E.F.Ca.ET.041.01.1.1]